MEVYKKTALALFAITLIGLGAPLAAAQGSGILYQHAAGIVSLETDDISIKVTGNDQAPHFHWWDPNSPDVDYHVMFARMFEVNDTNGNGLYDHGSEPMIGAPFALPTIGWDFSGFETVEVNGTTTEVHFNFTTNSTFDPRPVGGNYTGIPDLDEFEVEIEINVHMYLENPGEFKFDLVVAGWGWTYEDSLLVVMFTVTESAHGQSHGDSDPTGFQREGTKFEFRNGYFEYNETALAAQNTLEVKASYGESSGEYSGNAIFLSFENFGDDTLEYDPIIGITPDAGIILDPMTMGIVGGVAVIAILAIALARRR